MRIRDLFTARNMTEGTPWKRIAEFAIPMLIGNLAQQLYNTVDAIVVGRFVGSDALAAVGGSAGMIVSLIGQGMNALEAAACGAYLHGAAGDLCACQMGQYAMLPSDMLSMLPRLLK